MEIVAYYFIIAFSYSIAFNVTVVSKALQVVKEQNIEVDFPFFLRMVSLISVTFTAPLALITVLLSHDRVVEGLAEAIKEAVEE